MSQHVTAGTLFYLDLPFPVNPDREAKAEARWRYSTAPTPSTGYRQSAVFGVVVFDSYVYDES